jgi:hypothetical protein
MCLLLEIGMLIAGIVALVRGEFSWTRNKVVRGAAARVVGALLLLPLLLAFTVGVAIVSIHTANGRPPNDPSLRATLGFTEAASIILFFVIAILIAAIYAEPLEPELHSRRNEDFEDEDDRPRPRSRPRPRRAPRYEFEQEDDLPSRRRHRYEDDEDRPRRPDDRIRE